MGYCYNSKTGALACDSCGSSTGGARKVKCPFGWCPPPALCKECRAKHKAEFTKEKHASCKVHSDAFHAERTRESELNAAGIHTRCAAMGQDNGTVRVMFAINRESKGAIMVEMSHECYDSIPLGTVARLTDYEKHSPCRILSVTGFHDKEPEPEPLQLAPIQTDEQLTKETATAQARETIKERAARRLTGTAGEFGTRDMLDTTAGQMSLFNF